MYVPPVGRRLQASQKSVSSSPSHSSSSMLHPQNADPNSTEMQTLQQLWRVLASGRPGSFVIGPDGAKLTDTEAVSPLDMVRSASLPLGSISTGLTPSDRHPSPHSQNQSPVIPPLVGRFSSQSPELSLPGLSPMSSAESPELLPGLIPAGSPYSDAKGSNTASPDPPLQPMGPPCLLPFAPEDATPSWACTSVAPPQEVAHEAQVQDQHGVSEVAMLLAYQQLVQLMTTASGAATAQTPPCHVQHPWFPQQLGTMQNLAVATYEQPAFPQQLPTPGSQFSYQQQAQMAQALYLQTGVRLGLTLNQLMLSQSQQAQMRLEEASTMSDPLAFHQLMMLQSQQTQLGLSETNTHQEWTLNQLAVLQSQQA